MKMKKSVHTKRISKTRPSIALEPSCDLHDTAKERKKCHKGKIAPPAP